MICRWQMMYPKTVICFDLCPPFSCVVRSIGGGNTLILWSLHVECIRKLRSSWGLVFISLLTWKSTLSPREMRLVKYSSRWLIHTAQTHTANERGGMTFQFVCLRNGEFFLETRQDSPNQGMGEHRPRWRKVYFFLAEFGYSRSVVRCLCCTNYLPKRSRYQFTKYDDCESVGIWVSAYYYSTRATYVALA